MNIDKQGLNGHHQAAQPDGAVDDAPPQQGNEMPDLPVAQNVHADPARRPQRKRRAVRRYQHKVKVNARFHRKVRVARIGKQKKPPIKRGGKKSTFFVLVPVDVDEPPRKRAKIENDMDRGWLRKGKKRPEQTENKVNVGKEPTAKKLKVAIEDVDSGPTSEEGSSSRGAQQKNLPLKDQRNSSENQQPGPSDPCMQVERCDSSLTRPSTPEEQENMEIEQESGWKAPVKRNKRASKRRLLEVAENVDTNEVGTHDDVAPNALHSILEHKAPRNKTPKTEPNHKERGIVEQVAMDNNEIQVSNAALNSGAAPGSSQAAIDSAVPKNGATKSKDDHSEAQMTKPLEMQQKMGMAQMKEEQEEKRKKVEEKAEQGQQLVDNGLENFPTTEPTGNSFSVSTSNKELEIVVEKDELVIQAIPKEEQSAVLNKAKEFIDSELVELLNKPASDQSEETKWNVVRSTLQKVAKDLCKDTFINSPTEVFEDVVKTFKKSMLNCGHRAEEEKTLFEICQEFTRIMSPAFCCKRNLIATKVDESCKGHGDICKIEDGHRCFKKDEDYFCMKWLEEGNKRTKTMKEAIYRHFTPEQYETCTSCSIVWHKKCRLNRLSENVNSIQCRNSNDMLHIQHFSDHIGTTPLQKALSENYNTNRGALPEVRFIHSSSTTPKLCEMRNVMANRTEFTHTANQIFVTVLIQNVETMIFSFNTQEYCSGPKKGWVVIEYLDSLSILKDNRSRIYKRIIWSYLKYARDFGFKIAHLWSFAPERGADYIFSGHPRTQNFLTKIELNNWYLRLFQGGEDEGFGMMDTGFKETYFNEVLEKTTVEDMCRSLVLVNGFWNAEIEKILGKMRESENKGFEFFKNEINKVKEASESSLFYVKLTNSDEGMKKPKKGESFSNDITGDRDTFLNEQIQNDIEFTDLRQAQFATRQILMEVYLARHGTSGPRNTSKPYSVFSRSSIPPQWSPH